MCQLDPESLVKLDQLERSLDYEDIVLFRSLADALVFKELQLQQKSKAFSLLSYVPFLGGGPVVRRLPCPTCNGTDIVADEQGLEFVPRPVERAVLCDRFPRDSCDCHDRSPGGTRQAPLF